MAPDGAKMVQDEAKMAQDGARMAQDVGQTSPEERRQQNKKKSIHLNSRSSSFASFILYNIYIIKHIIYKTRFEACIMHALLALLWYRCC